MKILLICLLVVQITAVSCTYRRQSSRNSVSFLLRKVCVEVTGLKEEVAGLKKEVAGLKEENLRLTEKVAGLEEENSAMKQPVDGNWSGWLQWSGCSNNCGPGTRTRQRQCLDPRPSNGGSDCLGVASEMEECEITDCKDPYSAFAIYAEYASYQNRVLVWSSTDLNIASNNATHYNTSSGKYCPHHRGTYLFQLHMYKKPIATGSPICSIVKELPSGDLSNLAEARTSSGSLGGSTATIVDLEQGDCVWAGSCGGSLDDISFKTAFSGALLNLLD